MFSSRKGCAIGGVCCRKQLPDVILQGKEANVAERGIESRTYELNIEKQV